MAIQQMDNFTIYGTDTALLLNGVYAQKGSTVDGLDAYLTTDPDGISSGRVMNLPPTFGGASNYNVLRYVLQSTATTCGVCDRMWLSALPDDGSKVPIPVSFRDGSNVPIVTLGIDTTGRVYATRGGTNSGVSGSIIGTSASPAITSNGWYHFETKLVISATVGSVEVRVEGVTVLLLENIDTGTAPVAQVALANDPNSTSAGVDVFFKDFVVWDDSGTNNTDFLGSVIVTNLTPTSDVSLNWTPSAGTTGYEILDNIPPNDSITLDAPNPPPAAYVGEISNLPIDVTSVKAIQTYVRAAKSDGGDATLQISVISNGVTGAGADRPITVAQTYWRDVFETDPDTSAAWLPAAVDAAQIKLDRTS